MRPLTALLLAQLLLHWCSRVANATAPCPCHSEQSGNVFTHYGTCYVVQSEETLPVTWAQAVDTGNMDGCMGRHYTLATLANAYTRVVLSHKLRENGLLNGVRLRIALTTQTHNGSDWHWVHADGLATPANNTISPNWDATKSTGALHAATGQLQAASADEPLGALWMAAPARLCVTCVTGVAGTGTSDSTTTVANRIACEGLCQLTNCDALTTVPEGGNARVACTLHFGHKSTVDTLATPEAQFCSRAGCWPDGQQSECAPITVDIDSTVQYSTPTNNNNKYDGGTLATIACAEYPAQRLQAACGDGSLWLYSRPVEPACTMRNKVWLSHTSMGTGKWQEWAPGGSAATLPQESAFALTGGAYGGESSAAYYRAYAYFILASVGHAYRVGVADYGVTRLADIAGGYRRRHSAHCQLPNGRLLVCGGQSNSGVYVDTCFIYWLESGLTEWTTSMVGARRMHALCYYRGRVYAIGGYNTTALDVVQSMDAAALDAWREEPYMQYARTRLLQAVAVLNDKLYACSGQVLGDGYRDVCEMFDGSAWTQVGSLPRAISSGALVTLRGTMYYVGGYTSVSRAEISVYNETSDTWSDLTDRMAEPMSRFSAVSVW